MPTDTSEKGLETLIFQAMTGRTGLEPVPEALKEVSPTAAGGTSWLAGWPRDFDRTHALDTAQLFAFLEATQPNELKKLGIAAYSNKSDITLLKFLARVSSEIGKRGVIDVLRKGVDHGALHFDLFYGRPSPGNAKAAALFAKNRFSVTRQLCYSADETRRALDLCLFVNGLPIDEAHSSQGGKSSSAMSAALADPEDTVNDALEKRIQARKMLTNASYFAFTATPKNKTLEMFGQPLPPDAEGKVKHRPFHSYTMKQAIQEGFILDVLKSYTPVDSYYKLVKKIEGDPEFDTRRAQKKLRKYVQSHDHAIRLRAEIMVDHFHEQVMAFKKIGGKARAMVVCSGIERAVQYFDAFKEYLEERKSPYQAIVAFSGEHEFGGANVTESSLNGFSSGSIADKIQEDPYRFLICADKFQTGYDEPLLHTMYVDKPLSGIKAVQTLSRLNRAHPEKHDVFVLDFQNNTETIPLAFSDYYRTTVLSEETDPNKLHDLKAALDNVQVYSPKRCKRSWIYFSPALSGTNSTRSSTAAWPVTKCGSTKTARWTSKARPRPSHGPTFLASVLPYTNREWEKLSIVLNLLIPKLPAPQEEDLSKGILEAIDMDSYRVEKMAVMKIALADDNAEIGPVPVEGGGHKREPELDRLSNILKAFNDHFGTLFTEADRVARRIREDIAPKVAADPAYRNARQNTPNSARIEHDKALGKVMLTLLKDDTQVYKQFVENESFRRFVTDMVYALTND